MFTPIRTRRLTIRGFSADDVEDLVARRNDHRVAEYQNWPLPYTRAQADDLVSELVALGGPQDDAWWMAAVCDGATGETLGDLAVHLSAGGRSAEVGYTFASNQWGNGYAVEALESLIAYLFEDLGVTRVFGMLHPDNVASAMVLERCGLLFEGHTRSSFWLEARSPTTGSMGWCEPIGSGGATAPGPDLPVSHSSRSTATTPGRPTG